MVSLLNKILTSALGHRNRGFFHYQYLFQIQIETPPVLLSAPNGLAPSLLSCQHQFGQGVLFSKTKLKVTVVAKKNKKLTFDLLLLIHLGIIYQQLSYGGFFIDNSNPTSYFQSILIRNSSNNLVFICHIYINSRNLTHNQPIQNRTPNVQSWTMSNCQYT